MFQRESLEKLKNPRLRGIKHNPSNFHSHGGSEEVCLERFICCSENSQLVTGNQKTAWLVPLLPASSSIPGNMAFLLWHVSDGSLPTWAQDLHVRGSGEVEASLGLGFAAPWLWQGVSRGAAKAFLEDRAASWKAACCCGGSPPLASPPAGRLQASSDFRVTHCLLAIWHRVWPSLSNASWVLSSHRSRTRTWIGFPGCVPCRW